MLKVEDTEHTADSVRVFKPEQQGANIRPQGEDVKKGEDGVYSGEFTDIGVKELFARVRRSRTAPTDGKGSAKFWIKDGLLTKYQYSVQGKVTTGADGRERVTAVIVTAGRWGRLLGYESDDDTGPWLLESLARLILRRHTTRLAWRDVSL